MKKLYFILSLMMPFTAFAQQENATNSITTNLDEVVVTTDAKVETAKKVILRPTKLEKKHSTNGYTLLENMNLADFNVDAATKSISTAGGRDVRILINGVEVGPDELATLAATEIIQIDYQRNPGSRFVGSGAVMNFITTQYDYGGNIYLSADEGLARQYGNYIGMVNYKKKAWTLSLTANGMWEHSSQLKKAENMFKLNDGLLNQSISPVKSEKSTNSQYVNFKLAHATDRHSFDISFALTGSATPRNCFQDDMTYTGLYDFTSETNRHSYERSLSPVVKMHYNLYLPGGHTLMADANIRHGHTNYRSNYRETNVDDIQNNTKENNVLASVTFSYFKSFGSSLSLGMSIDEYYNYYRDIYSGSFISKQVLKNNHAMAILHLDHNLPFGLTYYISTGLTNLYSTIDNHNDNQFAPMAFYGVTYALNQKHSFSITGSYLHTIYNPSYKNDAVIRTSLFESTKGNPDLKQVNSYQNYISYNGQFGHLDLSFTYDFLKYFDNTSNRYFAEDNIMYHQIVNDGNFFYNKLIFGLSINLLDNKLRMKGSTIFSMNRFKSEYRPVKSNDWRGDFSVSYMFGDWQVKGYYTFPYNVLGIEGINTRNPAQYGITFNWQRGDWAAECSFENLFNRRMSIHTNANYDVFRSKTETLNDLKGRNIRLGVTYTLPYGKKTEREHVITDSKINSAILRPF